MLNFVFNLSLLPRWENTLSYYVFDAQLFRQPQIMPNWENTNSVVLCAGCSTLSSTSAYCLAEKTHSRIMCSMLNSFVNLRSCLIEKTQTLLYYVLDAQLCLQPQLFASLRKHTIVLCVRCLTLSSTSDHAALRKHKLCCIMSWMLNFVFNLSLLPHWENTLSYYVFDA